MKLKLFAYSTIFILMFTLWSCDDDSPTGPDLDDAPAAPSMENVSMDFSIFDGANQFKQLDANSTSTFSEEIGQLQQNGLTSYEQAAIHAITAQFWFEIMSAFPTTFFQEQQWGDPKVDGNTWIWEWSHSFEGESVSMVITAETTGDERHWELRYSTQGMEEELDNALFLSAQVSLDESYGQWQMYDFMDETTPVFEIKYELDGEVTTLVDFAFDQENDGRFLYEREGEIISLFFGDVVDGQGLIQWNNETGVGFIESPGYRDGERVCWDENFQNTEC